jgi:hypothetical protein
MRNGVFALAALGLAACGQDATNANTPSGTGGSAGNQNTGGAARTGGSPGTGGSIGSGGSPTAGGATGSGGSPTAGGATGSGGSPTAGGATGSGGSLAGGGSTGTSGGAIGKGGSNGSGGATGSGGGKGTGGTTGSGGTTKVPDGSGGGTGTGGTTGSGGTTKVPNGSGGGTGTGGSTTSSYDTLASQGEFSFFAVSLKFIKSKAPCQGTDGKTCLGGLGGDLRNGKSNGIDGADSLCTEAAQLASPGDKHLWRAFLSASSYNGAVLNAMDRVGTGPWYSAPPAYQKKTNYASEGLLLAKDKAGLLTPRPDGDSTTVVYNGVNQSMGAGSAQSWPFAQCLTNEYGYCVQSDGDTHDTLTGTNNDGTYAGSKAATCDDWTNSTKDYGSPSYGHTWPRQLNATDAAAKWINIGEKMNACGAIINVTNTNYGGGGGGPGMGGGGSTDTTYVGGVGSGGGYGGFYCFAYITGSE